MYRKFLLAIAGTALVATLVGAGAADAAERGYATANVNMRAGPGTGYPVVEVVPEGASVIIYGCLDDWSWCDTAWDGERGWVYSAYLASSYHSTRVPVRNYGLTIGLPIITFTFGDYWDNHYRSRRWYRDRDSWNPNYTRRNDGNRNWNSNRNLNRYRTYDSDRDRTHTEDRWERPSQNNTPSSQRRQEQRNQGFLRPRDDTPGDASGVNSNRY